MRSSLRVLALVGVLAIAALAAFVLHRSFDMPLRNRELAGSGGWATPGSCGGEDEEQKGSGGDREMAAHTTAIDCVALVFTPTRAVSLV